MDTDVPPLAAVLGSVTDIFTDNVVALLMLSAAGMLVGIATTGMVRVLWLPLDGDLPKLYYEQRVRWLRVTACLLGSAWTAAAASIYTAACLSENPVVIGLAISALAPVAGAGTPLMFDAVKWARYRAAPAAGHAAIELMRRYAERAAAMFK